MELRVDGFWSEAWIIFHVFLRPVFLLERVLCEAFAGIAIEVSC